MPDYNANFPDLKLDALNRPTATSCHSAAEDVVVVVRNNSGILIDFAVTPATITVTVTGPEARLHWSLA